MQLQYFQIKDLVLGLLRKQEITSDLTELEIMLCNLDSRKKKILYTNFCSKGLRRLHFSIKSIGQRMPRSLACYKILEWLFQCICPQISIIEDIHQAVPYPDKLARIYKSHSVASRKDCGNVGTFNHCWWTFQQVSKYWSLVSEKISNITQISLPFRPEVFLLSYFELDLSGLKEKKYIIAINVGTNGSSLVLE